MRVRNLREQLIRAEALVEKLKSGENPTPDTTEGASFWSFGSDFISQGCLRSYIPDPFFWPF